MSTSAPENGTGTGGETQSQGTATTTKTENGDQSQHDQDWETSTGAGGKAAVLADLNKERQQRQQLATEAAELKAFKESVLKVLGGGEQKIDPEKLAQEHASTKAQLSETQRLLQVYQTAPEGADIKSLMDSVAFRQGLAAVEDEAKVEEFIKGFLKANPRYGVAGGSSDAGRRLLQGNQQNGGSGKLDMNAILRGQA